MAGVNTRDNVSYYPFYEPFMLCACQASGRVCRTPRSDPFRYFANKSGLYTRQLGGKLWLRGRRPLGGRLTSVWMASGTLTALNGGFISV